MFLWLAIVPLAAGLAGRWRSRVLSRRDDLVVAAIVLKFYGAAGPPRGDE